MTGEIGVNLARGSADKGLPIPREVPAITISKTTNSETSIIRTLRLSLLATAMLAAFTFSAAGETNIYKDVAQPNGHPRSLAAKYADEAVMRLTMLAYALLAIATPALAVSQRDHADCTATDPAHSIAGCTRIVEDLSESAKNRALAHVSRGLAYLEHNDLDSAIADFSRAIAVAPRFAGPYFNRAITRQGQGLLDLALADLAEVTGLEPSLARAHYARAEIFMAKQDPDGAIAELDAMIALDPDSPVVYYMRGAARYDRYMRASALIDPEDLKRAIADFSKAIEKGPYYTEAYRARAMAEEANGERELAAADLAKAEGRDPIRFRLRDELQ
jgi:tetratricopeptide (TPR) repeat protein